MQVNFNVLNQEGAPAIFEGENIPEPGFFGRLFFSTAQDGIYWDNVTEWLLVASPNYIPTLQRVTEQGNSTTQKIELINNNSTVDALSIALNNEDSTGINIFGSYEFQNGIVLSHQNDNCKGLIIEGQGENFYGIGIYNDSDGGYAINIRNTQGVGIHVDCDTTTAMIVSSIDNLTIRAYNSTGGAIYGSSNYDTAIIGTSHDGFGGYFSSNDTYGVVAISPYIPLLLQNTESANNAPAIAFNGQYIYTGATSALGGEYIPITVNGVLHYLKLYNSI